jgi:hypothetical protein
MVLAAFSGTSFSTAVIAGFNEGIKIGAELQRVVAITAETIPSKVSVTWLNWIIVRFTIVLPTQYLLQMNSFVFSFLGLKCCSRVVRGGGGKLLNLKIDTQRYRSTSHTLMLLQLVLRFRTVFMSILGSLCCACSLLHRRRR